MKLKEEVKKNLDNIIRFQLQMNVWTNVYGTARSMLALSTFLTLLFNNIYILYKPYAGGSETCISCDGLAASSIFCVLPLQVAKWTSIIILFLVIIGYCPRLTAMLHTWVVTSFMNTALLVDGGDQVTTVLSVLLLPIALTDDRKWHWSSTKELKVATNGQKVKILVAHSAWLMIRLQVALIYFEACMGKFKNVEWTNGTAVYYWLSNAQFGLPPAVLKSLLPLLANPIAVVVITWGVLIFEAVLFLGIAFPRHIWKRLLVGGIVFHFFIFLVHGLPTFFLSMTAALILFLRHPENPFMQRLPFKFSVGIIIKKRRNGRKEAELQRI